jgi:CRISPR/Cas system CSM-associated protein Csm2 small subunit
MVENAGVTAPVKAAVVDPKAPPVIDPKAEPTEAYVVGGKTYNWTKAQARAYAQKGFNADQKLKSMDVLAKSSQSLLAALKTPEGILNLLKDPALGNSPKEVFKKLMASDIIDDELKESMSQWVYQNVVQKAKLTPEEIEKDKKLNDYERLKKAEDAQKAKGISDQQQAQVNQVYQAVRSEVTKQVLADKTFPQTEGSIRAVVEKLRVMNKKGAPITAENIGKALSLVKKDHVLHQQTMLDAIENPEDLIALVGEARALKISRALVARLQAKQKGKPKVEVKPEGDEPRKKTTELIDEKLGRNKHGYSEMKF